MCGAEMGQTQNKVSLWVTSDAMSVQQTRPKRTSIFSLKELIWAETSTEERFHPNTSNKSASQPCSYHFTAVSPSVEQG